MVRKLAVSFSPEFLCSHVCQQTAVDRSVQKNNAPGIGETMDNSRELERLAAMLATMDSWQGEGQSHHGETDVAHFAGGLQQKLSGVDLSAIKKIVDMRGALDSLFPVAASYFCANFYHLLAANEVKMRGLSALLRREPKVLIIMLACFHLSKQKSER